MYPKKITCISDHENDWGNCEPIKGNLVVGKEYEIARVEVHSWHTKVWLKGFPRPFNSVHFGPEDLSEYVDEDDYDRD